MGNKNVFEKTNRRKIGNNMEFKMGNNMILETSFFNKKQEKQENTGTIQ